mmetsp:Transcript_109680/g.354093  ORF Transcript_109680/g.354093 Transcript_109680/m.354093 type:complete len:669 (-) Transcript_109680:34-2040(-)
MVGPDVHGGAHTTTECTVALGRPKEAWEELSRRSSVSSCGSDCILNCMEESIVKIRPCSSASSGEARTVAAEPPSQRQACAGEAVCTPLAVASWALMCCLDLSALWWPSSQTESPDQECLYSRGIALATLGIALIVLFADWAWLRYRNANRPQQCKQHPHRQLLKWVVGGTLARVATKPKACSEDLQTEAEVSSPAGRSRRATAAAHCALLGGGTSWLGLHAASGREPQVWAGVAALGVLLAASLGAAVGATRPAATGTAAVAVPAARHVAPADAGLFSGTAGSHLWDGRDSLGRRSRWRPLFQDLSIRSEFEALSASRDLRAFTASRELAAKARVLRHDGSHCPGYVKACGADNAGASATGSTDSTSFRRSRRLHSRLSDARPTLAEGQQAVEAALAAGALDVDGDGLVGLYRPCSQSSKPSEWSCPGSVCRSGGEDPGARRIPTVIVHSPQGAPAAAPGLVARTATASCGGEGDGRAAAKPCPGSPPSPRSCSAFSDVSSAVPARSLGTRGLGSQPSGTCGSHLDPVTCSAAAHAAVEAVLHRPRSNSACSAVSGASGVSHACQEAAAAYAARPPPSSCSGFSDVSSVNGAGKEHSDHVAVRRSSQSCSVLSEVSSASTAERQEAIPTAGPAGAGNAASNEEAFGSPPPPSYGRPVEGPEGSSGDP